jgi:hypothetical protein
MHCASACHGRVQVVCGNVRELISYGFGYELHRFFWVALVGLWIYQWCQANARFCIRWAFFIGMPYFEIVLCYHPS